MAIESEKRFSRNSRRRGDTASEAQSGSAAPAGREAGTEGHPAAEEPSRDHVTRTYAKRSRRRATVTFGWVKLREFAPPAEEIARNIASGNSALSRAASTFTRPGVKLPRGKNVPLYRADPVNPRILIRELHGRSERVTLVDGEFKLAE